MANTGHYRRAGGTRQGIYVCSPSGKLLSSINSLNSDDVLETIRSGLKKWNDLSLSEQQLPRNHKVKAMHRWENRGFPYFYNFNTFLNVLSALKYQYQPDMFEMLLSRFFCYNKLI